jgi:hypothetical protein
MHFKKIEWQSQIGTPGFEKALLRAIRADGFFILEEALSPGLLARLKAAFGEVLQAYLETNSANRGVNRFNMHLTVDGVFADEEFVANPLIMPVVRKILGVDVACSWVAADTPLPGSDYQVAHADGRPLFRDSDLSLPTYALAINVPLVDFTEENGPLEIWGYGSHLVPDVAPHLGAADRAPIRVLMPAGSLLVRDTRMWHRGSPNVATEARPNLALVYNRGWYRFEGEAGHTPPVVSAEAYKGWSLTAQRLFRFATTDLALTEARRIEMAYGLEDLEAEAGLSNGETAQTAARA